MTRHDHFGHLNFEALKQLSITEMVQGMPRVEHMEHFCNSCILTKRLPFPHQASFLAKEKLEPIDDEYHYIWALLRMPSSCSRKLRVLCYNNNDEFTAAEFATYYADEGIKRHFSAPYTLQ
jgi:hypothetical protein